MNTIPPAVCATPCALRHGFTWPDNLCGDCGQDLGTCNCEGVR